MKSVKLHEKARSIIQTFAKPVRRDIGELLMKLQLGVKLGMPVSKPMQEVYSGVHELRLKDASGIFRVFYYLKSADAILVFHAFAKKTQTTPIREIEIARKRLLEML